MDNQKELKVIEIQLDGYTRKGVEGCKECLDKYAPSHFNCLYEGKAIGHSSDGHCTADACY